MDEPLLSAVNAAFPIVRDDLALAQTDLDEIVGFRSS